MTTSASGIATIVVDAMGGDKAPGVNVKGALKALKSSPNLKIILTGDEAILRAELKKRKTQESEHLQIVHAPETISMEDHAAQAVRKKKNSSIAIGLEILKDKKADAFISAGNSGAVMAGALFVLGRLPNVERPAIVVRLPTAEGFVSLIDVGANVDCKPSHLFQFAEMGSSFAEIVCGIEKPRVALLSNGSEAHKGNELTREAHALLEKAPINYRGYVEGYDLFKGKADVIVCDGFVGNVALKLAEGLADSAFNWFRREIRRDWLGMLGVLLMRRVLLKFRNKFDYQPYGAAPLLGIDGLVLISHGKSTNIAIQNGILTAQRAVEQGFQAAMTKLLAHRIPEVSV